jgi:outer membrane autotransporter protein
MHLHSPGKKILTVAVLSSLLAATPVWAAEQTATTTVTGGTAADDPYRSITITGDGYGIQNGAVDSVINMTTDGQGTITVTADHSTAADISANATGIANTVDGTGTNPTLTVNNGAVIKVSATAGTGAGSQSNVSASATGVSVSSNSNTKLDAVQVTATAAAGTRTTSIATEWGDYSGYNQYASATGISVNGAATLNASSAALTVSATGGDTSATANNSNASATGINFTDGTATISGPVTLAITANGGNYLEGGQLVYAKASAAGVTAYNTSDTSSQLTTGALTGTVTATGGKAKGSIHRNYGDSTATAYGAELTSGAALDADSVDLTVTATAGENDSGSGYDTYHPYAHAAAYGLANGYIDAYKYWQDDSDVPTAGGTLKVTGAAVVKVTAAGGTSTASDIKEGVTAYGLSNVNTYDYDGDVTSTLGSLDATVRATGGTAANTMKVDAYGLYNRGYSSSYDASKISRKAVVDITGTTTLNVSATGGTTVGSAQIVTAYGIMNQADKNDATVTLDSLDATVTATAGTVAATNKNTVEIFAYGLQNTGTNTQAEAASVTVNQQAVFHVTADGGKSEATIQGTDVEAYGIQSKLGKISLPAGADLTVTAKGTDNEEIDQTMATGIDFDYAGAAKDASYTAAITGPVTLTVTATGGNLTTDKDNDGGTQVQATGISAYIAGSSSTDTNSKLQLTLGDVSGTIKASTGTNTGGNMMIMEVSALGINVTGDKKDGSTLSATTGNVNLTVTAQNNITNTLAAIMALGLSCGENATLQVQGDAIITAGATSCNTNDLLEAESLSAIDGGALNVGTDGQKSLAKTVQLQGDVMAYNGGTVNLTLDGKDSYLQGNVRCQSFDPEGLFTHMTTTSGVVNLIVTNGATWRPVYDNRYGSLDTITEDTVALPAVAATFADNGIGTLALSNGGIVDLTWDNATRDAATAGRTLTIDALSGDGGIFKINSNLAQNKADEITLGSASTSTSVGIDVAYDPALAADNLTTASSITGSALVLTDNSKQLTSVKGVADSYNLYDYTPTITDNGDGTYSLTQLTITNIETNPTDPTNPTDDGKQTVTSQTKPMRDARHSRMAMHNLWVNGELNNLQKRLGDLRAVKPADSGIWARYEYDKLEKGSDASLKYNMFQLGYDKDYQGTTGTFYRGAAFSYAKGTGSYEVSNGDLKEGTLSLYQTWAGKDGRYYDVILKGGKLMNSYDLYDTANPSSADYHSWAYSLSGEIGKRFNKANGFYLEPQFEFTLGRINGADYTTSTGMDVNVSSQNTALARLGISAGRETAKGSYFAKASYYHDFGGGLNLTASDSTTNPYSYGEDIAKNWLVFSLGGTAKAGKNCNIYGELSKFAGQLTNDVQVNIGARWSF